MSIIYLNLNEFNFVIILYYMQVNKATDSFEIYHSTNFTCLCDNLNK